jgi:hypothetical protein
MSKGNLPDNGNGNGHDGGNGHKPKAVGRPKAVVDLKLVAKLAKIQCTQSEISAVLDVPLSTLNQHEEFTETYKRNLEGGKMSIRRLQFRLAEKSAAMAIWLGKQYLGQKDRVEIDPGELFKGQIDFVESPNEGNRIKAFLQ